MRMMSQFSKGERRKSTRDRRDDEKTKFRYTPQRKHDTREHGDASPPTDDGATEVARLTAHDDRTRDSSNPRNRRRPTGAGAPRPDEPAAGP